MKGQGWKLTIWVAKPNLREHAREKEVRVAAFLFLGKSLGDGHGSRNDGGDEYDARDNDGLENGGELHLLNIISRQRRP